MDNIRDLYLRVKPFLDGNTECTGYRRVEE